MYQAGVKTVLYIVYVHKKAKKNWIQNQILIEIAGSLFAEAIAEEETSWSVTEIPIIRGFPLKQEVYR